MRCVRIVLPLVFLQRVPHIRTIPNAQAAARGVVAMIVTVFKKGSRNQLNREIRRTDRRVRMRITIRSLGIGAGALCQQNTRLVAAWTVRLAGVRVIAP